MAELLISVVLEQLVFQQAEQEMSLLLGVDDEINSLKTRFNILKGLLEDAEEKQITSKGVKAWLEDVKDIAYRTDDVLDEWRTKLLQGTTITDSSINAKKNKQVFPCFSCLSVCLQRTVVRHDIGHRIKLIKRQLDENVRYIDQLKLIPNEPTSHHQKDLHLERRTTSFVDVSNILGRDGDKEDIMKWLLNDSNQQQLPQVHAIEVGSIVGTGGFGKTTLAQLIFHQENVKTTFESRIWVCVSEPVDLQRIAKEIIELITKAKPNVDGLEALLQCLYESVKGKHFLLILDDVWSKSLKPWWDQLKNSLCSGASGSKIMVTTRFQEVATTMHSSYTHSLHQLSEEDCWLLFQQIAFSAILPNERCQFEKIGKDIAKKCTGVPLATKTIASLMQFKKTIHDWQCVLDNNVWEYVGKDLSPALLLSYYDLPSHLKQCFMYCAVIPKDTVMEKKRLVQLWMAQGFLGSHERKELEMNGEELFNELAMRSFFQDFVKDSFGSVVSCKMHDLVHDFAQSLTRTECCVIQTNDRETCSSKVRHLSVPDIENPNISMVKKDLRILITSSLVDSTDVSKWLRELTCLRTLDLSRSNLKELPKEVELLLHLRYLDVSLTKLTELPETVCKLCNLQTLKLNYCLDLCKLPDRIGELSNLRHFEIEHTSKLMHFPEGIGRSNKLRTLSKFVVSAETKGCRIGELGNLIHLGGCLRIERLWQVDNMIEAKQAGLQEKKNLDTLVLIFSGRQFASAEDKEKMEGVLKGLQPHNNLKTLTIADYPGKTINLEIIPGLRHLSLFECGNLKALPALSELQFLESLTIEGNHSMKHVSAELLKIFGGVNGETILLELFPNLKNLSLRDFPEWEEEDEESYYKTTTTHSIISIMPCLFSLWIDMCPKLNVLPHYMFSQTLKELRIWSCPGLSEMQPCLPPLLEKLELWGNVGVLSMSLMPNNNNNIYPNLKCVTISYSEISSLPQGLTQFMSLQKLELFDCKFLDFKPEEEFRLSLHILTIYICNCPLLEERNNRENWSNLSNFPKIIFEEI